MYTQAGVCGRSLYDGGRSLRISDNDGGRSLRISDNDGGRSLRISDNDDYAQIVKSRSPVKQADNFCTHEVPTLSQKILSDHNR